MQRDLESFLLMMCATKRKQANITNQKSLKGKSQAQRVPSIKKKKTNKYVEHQVGIRKITGSPEQELEIT